LHFTSCRRGTRQLRQHMRRCSTEGGSKLTAISAVHTGLRRVSWPAQTAKGCLRGLNHRVALDPRRRRWRQRSRCNGLHPKTRSTGAPRSVVKRAAQRPAKLRKSSRFQLVPHPRCRVNSGALQVRILCSATAAATALGVGSTAKSWRGGAEVGRWRYHQRLWPLRSSSRPSSRDDRSRVARLLLIPHTNPDVWVR